jgi:undecaprenyl-diphosphatase
MSIWFIAVILGLVEGITEFIPVSSTGHLLLAEHFLGVDGTGNFFHSEVFNAVIQAVAMLAALPLFGERLATLKRLREPAVSSYFFKMAVAFVITAVGALAFKAVVKHLHPGEDSLLPKTVMPVATALAIGGVLFVWVESWLRGRKVGDTVTWSIAVAIGLAQVVAVVFPGSSRSGCTILIALAMGLGRGAATEFSFLLGVPTLCAAAVKTLWDAHKTHDPILWGPLIITSAVAGLASFLAVRWLLGYVRSHTFTGFGWYRIAVGAALFALYFGGGLQ